MCALSHIARHSTNSGRAMRLTQTNDDNFRRYSWVSAYHTLGDANQTHRLLQNALCSCHFARTNNT
jgi:hypothetical protein